MPTPFNGKFTGGDIDCGTTVQTCPNKSASDGEIDTASSISIRACLFFDGTLNNRTNVEQGKLGKRSGGSYDNELSNIAILAGYWEKYANVDFSFSVYVEGIGTTNFKSDSDVGAALGVLETGIVAKVENGIFQTIANIKKHYPGKKQIKNIYLDAIGFSRGAAAARNFVYATLDNKGKTLKDQLAAEGYKVSNVSVKFIGLYDTVASYGVNHDSNTMQLHLDSICSAEKVVQLAAAEEHRKNFRLTNINSATNGHQIFLPGAHSDIGGGYTHNSNEDGLQILDLDEPFGLSVAAKAAIEREMKWLLESGWYLKNEIQEVNCWNELKINRKGISNRYSRIPLKMMALYASENGVQFRTGLDDDNRVPEELQLLELAIAESSPTTPYHWLNLNSQMMKGLRHDYLHFSAYYGSTAGANEPQFTGNDPVTGHRERVIQNG
jgi:hypothetical protein